MPTINKKPIYPDPVPYKRESQEEARRYYGRPAWINTREHYFSRHPLCECCMKMGRVVPAAHVHHRRRFLSGATESERSALLIDEKNLMSLCPTCHHALHYKMRHYGMDFCDELTDTEWKNAHQL